MLQINYIGDRIMILPEPLKKRNVKMYGETIFPWKVAQACENTGETQRVFASIKLTNFSIVFHGFPL